MKYYSDITKKLYETEDALIEAEVKVEEERIAREKAAEEAKAVKETRTAELDAAFKALVEAEKTYQKIAKAYYKDYPMSKNEINKALDEIFKIFA